MNRRVGAVGRAIRFAATVPALVAALAIAPAVTAATVDEYDAAYEVMLNQPENLDAIIKFTTIATQLGEYEVAVGALERLLLFSSDLPTVRADLGFLYFRLGSREIARYHLLSALNSGKLPPELETRTERLVEEVNGTLSRHQFSGAVNFGMRYQTNANSAASDDRVLAGGVLVQLNSANQEQSDVDFFASANGRYRYDLQMQNSAAIEVDMGLAVDQFVDESNLRGTVASLNPGFRFELDPVDNKGVTLFPHLLSRVVQRGGDLLSHSFGVGVGLRYAARADLFGQIVFQHRRSDFHNSTSRPSASDRDGFSNRLSAGARYRLTNTWFLTGNVHAVQRDANQDFNSSFEWGARARLLANYSTTLFGGESRRLTSYLSAGLRDIRYSAADPTVDPTVKRQAHEYSLGLGSTLTLNRDWSVSVEGSATNVTSNIRNFVRDNLSVSLSATRRF